MKDIYDERTGLGFIVKHNPASFFVLKQDQYLSDIIDDLYWKNSIVMHIQFKGITYGLVSCKSYWQGYLPWQCG